MNKAHLETLVKMRSVVGYLGEKEQFNWWSSSFFSSGSHAFLAPIFTKTQLLAQCSSVTRAAAITHDNRIGTGHVYHLFRLPEDIEQDIHQLLHSDQLNDVIQRIIVNQETAIQFLQRISTKAPSTVMGPVLIGNTIDTIRNIEQWHMISAYYVHGFQQNIEIYPYFSDST